MLLILCFGIIIQKDILQVPFIERVGLGLHKLIIINEEAYIHILYCRKQCSTLSNYQKKGYILHEQKYIIGMRSNM